MRLAEFGECRVVPREVARLANLVDEGPADHAVAVDVEGATQRGAGPLVEDAEGLRHGGAIRVESELGSGTTFEVTLPVPVDAT